MQSAPILKLAPASLWILFKYQDLEATLETHVQDFEMAHSVDAIYKFLWDFYADWYVEYLKTDDSQITFAKELFRQFVITSSPYLPFQTEALWERFFGETSLLAYKIKDKSWTTKTLSEAGNLADLESKAREFKSVIEFIQDLRSLRGLFAIDPASKLEIQSPTPILSKYQQFIQLAGRANLDHLGVAKSYEIQKSNYTFSLDILNYLPDKQKEIGRTNKLIQDLEKQIHSLKAQLDNPQFVERAGAEVVSEKQDQLEQRELEINQQLEKLRYLEK